MVSDRSFNEGNGPPRTVSYASESSLLLAQSSETSNHRRNGERALINGNGHFGGTSGCCWFRRGATTVVTTLIVVLAGLVGTGIGYWYGATTTRIRVEKRDNRTFTLLMDPFPADFVWGVATSAYQIEGAVEEDGRGETIWDRFVNDVPNAVVDNSTGEVADDHYHKFKDDVALMKSLNIKAYRFSIAWSRILPLGYSGSPINEAGVSFYNDLIDELLRNDIEPWITLFHWDLPQTLQDDYDGWLSSHTVAAFYDYAHIVFDRFAHKVKRFITLNEPWTYAVNGHGTGVHAPGRNAHPSTEPYLVGHNFLLAHAKVAQLYKARYAGDSGMIGISNCGDFRYPLHNRSESDEEAAERAMLFQWGWFVEPLIFGRYPIVMRKRLGNRLPRFTKAEQRMLLGSADFLGLNYYSSLLASKPRPRASYDGYWADIHVDFSDDPIWKKNDMGWNVVPRGLKDMLVWISDRYDSPLVYITENGSADDDHNPAGGDRLQSLRDENRTSYFHGHVQACANALKLGHVNLAGYFAWSLMDNFEWQFGYTRRFGLCKVDFDTLERTPRDSALWYRDMIHFHGKRTNLNRRDRHRMLPQRTEPSTPTRSMPDKVLIGYGNKCGSVRRAVHDGVNLVMWSFLDVSLASDPISLHRQLDKIESRTVGSHRGTFVATNLNLTAVRMCIEDLRMSGYAHVLHFASVGGWNGAHLNEQISAGEWYQTFSLAVGDMFDGIDWDLEGNDHMESENNFFTLECLDKMGAISQLAKADGRFVSIAPPQSYLDTDSVKFSRYVNLTDCADCDDWHREFSYYGANVYAYLLFRYGDMIDLASIQFYESYSRAGRAVYHDGKAASDYLIDFVTSLVSNNESMLVDFSNDSELQGLGWQRISLPLSKLVFGLGNGWAGGGDHKALYIPPDQLQKAWTGLSEQGRSPRGFMFWSIMDEGTCDVYLARELDRILHATR